MNSLVAYLVAAMIGWSSAARAHAVRVGRRCARSLREHRERRLVGCLRRCRVAGLLGTRGAHADRPLDVVGRVLRERVPQEGRRRPRVRRSRSLVLLDADPRWYRHHARRMERARSGDRPKALLSRGAAHPAKLVRRLPHAARRRSSERIRHGALLRRRGDLSVSRREGARLARGSRSTEAGARGDDVGPPRPLVEAEGQLNVGAGQPCLYRWKSATLPGPRQARPGRGSGRRGEHDKVALTPEMRTPCRIGCPRRSTPANRPNPPRRSDRRAAPRRPRAPWIAGPHAAVVPEARRSGAGASCGPTRPPSRSSPATCG